MDVQRVSGNDVAEFATETPHGPRQMAVVLRLDRPVPADALIRALGRRVPRVPRLRQRLCRVPPGLGRPVWVDDAAFDLHRHVRRRVSTEPRDEAVVLSVAAQAAVEALPRDRPLWAVTLILDPEQGCHALVLVVHHGLADGIGGLAELVELMDRGDPGSPSPPSGFPPSPALLQAPPSPALPQAPLPPALPQAPLPPAFPQAPLPPPSPAFPRPPPTWVDLLRDLTRTRIRAVSGLAADLGRLRGAIAGFRTALPHRPEHRRRRLGQPRRTISSLNRPIGPRRQLAVARIPTGSAVDTAHRRRVTVNDILLSAVGGALHSALLARGENPDRFVISVPVSVPVSARRGAGASRLGNHVGVISVPVPACGSGLQRLRQVAESTRAQRAPSRDGSAPAVLGAAVLGTTFRAASRALARLRLFGWLIDRQRLVNTFVSNIRGPRDPLTLLGATITEIVPVSPIAGNITVAFAALSYAGTLIVTVIADPDTCPDIRLIATALQRELDELTG